MSALREILALFSIELDDSQLKKGDASIGKTIQSLTHLGEAVGAAFAFEKIKEFVLELVDEAVALQRHATALGLSAQELEGWQNVASRSGVSAESLTNAIGRLQRNVGSAADGSKETSAAFAKLGVSLRDSNGHLRSGGDLFEDSALKLGAMENATERNALASKLFGRSFLELIPIFGKSREEIAQLRGEVEEMGAGFDDAFIQQAKEVKGSLARFHLALRGLGIQIVTLLLPAIASTATAFAKIVFQIGKFLKHTEIAKTALVALSLRGFLALSKAMGPLGLALRGTGAGLLQIGKFALRTLLPLLLLEDFLGFLAGKDSLFGRAIDAAFGDGSQDKVRTFIKDVKDQFFAFVKDLISNGWEHFRDKSIAIFDGLLLALQIVWTELKFGFLGVVATVEDAFGGLWNGILDGASDMLRTVADLLTHLPGTGALVEQIGGALDSITGARSGQTNSAETDQEHYKARLRLADLGDSISARLAPARAGEGIASFPPAAGAGGAPVTQQNVVNVTVPPGTPEQTARRVGDAAAAGVSRTTPTLRETAAAMSFAGG